MFSKIRHRFTYTNVILTIALVFAMSGGAYAAKKYLITSTSQISPKVLKSLQGKTGANGAPGAPGAQGAAGPAGAQGPQGPAGSAGAKGDSGTNGESVTTTTLAKGVTCPEGGTEFKVGTSKAHACNGKEGEPWTDGGTLPSGKTETGVWTLPEVAKTTKTRGARIPISFTIPLSSALDEHHVKVIGEGEEGQAGEGCGGGSSKTPTAEPGFLCVYIARSFEVLGMSSLDLETSEGGAGKTGAILFPFSPEEPEEGRDRAAEGASANGEWAVTAPE